MASWPDRPSVRIPEDEFRCEAMANGNRASRKDWDSKPHRCVRKANQMRGVRQVCAWHAKLEAVRWWNDEPVIGRVLPAELRVGHLRFAAGCSIDTAQGAIDRLKARHDRLEAALRMGLQLGESGKHGDGDTCPTCHFVKETKKALK